MLVRACSELQYSQQAPQAPLGILPSTSRRPGQKSEFFAISAVVTSGSLYRKAGASLLKPHMLYYVILYYTRSFYIILYYTLLYSTLLYYTLLYSTLLYYTLLYYTLLYSNILYYTLLYSTILYSTLLYSTILYSTLLYYTLL